jgi:hypothetical protein
VTRRAVITAIVGLVLLVGGIAWDDLDHSVVGSNIGAGLVTLVGILCLVAAAAFAWDA